MIRMYFVKVLKDIQNNTIFVSSSFLYVFVCVCMYLYCTSRLFRLYLLTHMQNRMLPSTLPLTIQFNTFSATFCRNTQTHVSLSDFNIRGNNFNHISHVVWLFSNMFTFQRTFFCPFAWFTYCRERWYDNVDDKKKRE